jgi:uncharacterized protein
MLPHLAAWAAVLASAATPGKTLMSLVVDEVVRLGRGEGGYVFHVPTSSFYALDGGSASLLDELQQRGGLDEAEIPGFLPQWAGKLGCDSGDVGAILDDLRWLRLLVPEETRGERGELADRPPAGPGIRNLVLHVAHACNLACGYCYAEQGLYKGGKATLMTEERAREYVDWLFLQVEPETRQIGITFFGGEPLLNLPVVKAAAARAKEKAAETGRSVRFSMTTNGTLVTAEVVDFLEEIKCQVTVSLDAVGRVNDRLRPFHDGRGSYELILEKIRPLLDRHLAVARVTVTRQNLDVVHTVQTLLQEGFAEVGCSPVDAKNAAFDLDHEAYVRLLDGFRVLVRRFVDEASRGRRYGFSNIANILKAIHSGHNKDYPCGAGLQMVAGAPSGEMSLCHRFVGEPDYVLGRVQSGGLDPRKRLAVLDAIRLDERTDCAACWARYICSGGCHHVNFLMNGDPSRTYRTHCDWLRAWYRTGIEAYAEILERNPGFIEQLEGGGPSCRR